MYVDKKTMLISMYVDSKIFEYVYQVPICMYVDIIMYLYYDLN